MPTAPIKALLFDLGGVLINIDFDHTLRTWSAFTPLPFLELKAAFQQDRAYQQHETGEIDAVQYFDHLRAVLKLNASDEQIAAGWNAVLRDEIAETASLTGKVTLKGAEASQLRKVVDVGGNPFCTGHGEIVDPAWRVTADGALADAVITVPAYFNDSPAGPGAAMKPSLSQTCPVGGA